MKKLILGITIISVFIATPVFACDTQQYIQSKSAEIQNQIVSLQKDDPMMLQQIGYINTVYAQKIQDQLNAFDANAKLFACTPPPQGTIIDSNKPLSQQFDLTPSYPLPGWLNCLVQNDIGRQAIVTGLNAEAQIKIDAIKKSYADEVTLKINDLNSQLSALKVDPVCPIEQPVVVQPIVPPVTVQSIPTEPVVTVIPKKVIKKILPFKCVIILISCWKSYNAK